MRASLVLAAGPQALRFAADAVRAVPWGAFVTNVPFLAICAAHFAHNWGWFPGAASSRERRTSGNASEAQLQGETSM